jgi:hypothetical protein
LLAAILTGVNAFKAVVVDDSAYLLFARHLAKHPGFPYNFELFWYYEPQPANEILMPPVLPYWLAAGIALFGEHLTLLKLWLFPIAWMLTASLASLLRRFTQGNHALALTVLVLSPAILPQFNFMLDIPAVAFGLAGLVLFIRSCDRNSAILCLAAGLLAGLAMQTKYTQLVVPAVFVAYGISHRKWFLPILAIYFAAMTFGGWEYFVSVRSGESHFLKHFRETAATGEAQGLFARIEERFEGLPPLLSQLGGVALGFGLWGLRATGFPARWLALVVVPVLLTLASIALRPYAKSGDPYWFFMMLGIGSILVAVALLVRMIAKPEWRPWLPWNWERDNLFLALWLLIEIGGTLGLSPFPAARRVIGVALVIGIIAARGVGRSPGTPKWVAAVAIAWGLALTAIDTLDADAEREAVVKARTLIPASPGGTIWTSGHWGWQYYADIHGMTQIVPHRWEPQPGDWLVFPVLPDPEGFYRPWPPMPDLKSPANWKFLGEVVVDDPLPCQTVPNLYGGAYVLRGRNHPRLKVAVYRFQP